MSLRPGTGTEVRKKSYKTGVDADQARRRREDNLVEIRKNKREDNLLKKRREGLPPSQQQLLDGTQTAVVFEKRLESIPSIVQGVWSDDPALQLEATTQFRKLLSIERSPPIDEVIKAGVVPRFVEFLGRHDMPQLQFEAAWALTNVASGTSDHTRVVIEHGVVPMFAQLLSSGSDDVREQAVWALGNVAADSPSCRDLILGQGALMPLLAQLNEHSKLSMLRSATWTLSNFCHGKPATPFDQVKPALPILRQLIYLNDEDVLTDTCWALSYLSDGPNDKIQAVIEAGVCQRLVELLIHPSATVLIPALRTVGNIVTGDDSQTQFVIDNQVLPRLHQLLTQNHKKCIKQEACWTISNITAGNKIQIQAVIEADIILPLVQLLQHAEFDIKKEAAWAISNATSGGSHDQIQHLASRGCIKPLCDILICPDPRIITVCLEGLENILKVGEADKEMGMKDRINLYAQLVDECEGLDKIENLQTHDNNEIYEKAVKILERYWAKEELESIPSMGQGVWSDFYPSSIGSKTEQSEDEESEDDESDDWKLEDDESDYWKSEVEESEDEKSKDGKSYGECKFCLKVDKHPTHLCSYRYRVPKNAIVGKSCEVVCVVCGCLFRGSCCADCGLSRGRAFLKECTICGKKGEHSNFECPEREEKRKDSGFTYDPYTGSFSVKIRPLK